MFLLLRNKENTNFLYETDKVEKSSGELSLYEFVPMTTKTQKLFSRGFTRASLGTIFAAAEIRFLLRQLQAIDVTRKPVLRSYA